MTGLKVSVILALLGGAAWLSQAATKVSVPDPVVEIAKLLALALPGYFAAKLQRRREQTKAEMTREDRLAAGWESMSSQAREQLTKAYEDVAREREAKRLVEERAEKLERRIWELERELAKLREIEQ